jgi:anti-anti-sigma factor
MGARSGKPTIALSMDIDMGTVEEVASMLRPFVEAGGPVPIDLSRVRFMDSSGVHLFLQAAAKLGDRGCVILHGANGGVAQVIEITHLASVRPNLHVIGCSVLAPA